MRDFETKKRQILDRVNIVDVAAEHVALKRKGQRWVGLCPFHAEKTPSFTIRPDHGTFKCFGCGKGGDLFSFVQSRENVSFVEAMRILADRAGVELDDVSCQEAAGPGRADLAKVNAWAMKYFRSRLLDTTIGRSAREYVRRRDISDATAERFQIGLATDDGPGIRGAAVRAGVSVPLLLAADLVRQNERGHVYDTFRNRLMFPIRDVTNRVIGFGGRTLGDDVAKYLNTRQTVLFDKGRGLYGIELARDAVMERGRAIVVEGYTDCLAAHQAGFLETVATLGTALTEAQVDLLRRYCEEIIILFDSDQAGESAADRAIHIAVPRCVTVRLARVPEGKDPSDFLGQATSDEFSDVLNRAVDALEFKWFQTRERFEGDASDVRRREAVLDFLRVVAEAVDANAVDVIQRGLLVNHVAHLLQMGRGDVDRLLARLQAKGVGRDASATGKNVAPGTATPVDPEQVAWVRILEVLLNEPGVLGAVEGIPDIAQIVDERDRRIATIVFDLVRELGEFRLADVLSKCHDAGDVERVAELARRGSGLTNYETTLCAACDRIHRARHDRQLEHSEQRPLSAAAPTEVDAGDADGPGAVAEGVKRFTQFVPRRFVRRTNL